MELTQQKQVKGYALVERIGAGGFGAVYRAKQSTVDREVAIKIILPSYANNPDFIRRFESEAHTIARLEHPHITPLIDYWRDPDGAYLVMRFLRGGSVRDALEKGAYELQSINQTLSQVTSALDFAHRNNIIHRDIKPENILLDEDGNAYLADFGIAKDLENNAQALTDPDGVIGSLDYISPEQARSEPVTARTDIYSLGVTLYEMVTGEHPFIRASSVERLYKHINEPLPDIVSLPDNLCRAVNDVVQKATAKDPDNRYPDALAFAQAFQEAIGQTQQEELSVIEQLTMRENEILAMIAEGKSNREIADDSFVTVGTVKWHIRQIYRKLGVRNRVQAIVRARELNLIVTGDTTQIPPPTSTGTIVSVALPEPENPYKGLRAFQAADSRDFFGREKLIEKLLTSLQAKHDHQRFLAVVGPSGSGKSSLVKAGLIPAIWKGKIPNSEKWYVVDMIPGKRPLDKLEIALMRVSADQSQNLREQLERDEFGLVRVADLILPDDDTELVIVIDQFEEVFTLNEDEKARQHFLDLVRTAVVEPRSRLRVIVTLRADFYDRPLMYPEFGELLRNRMETIMPLGTASLERAIRGPVERLAVTYEQGLVEKIITDMKYQAGALPLLQYALTELFDQRESRIITHDVYQKIGGAVGALANRADEIYNDLNDESKQLTRQMLMRLVTLGEGVEDTRRRVTHSELLSIADHSEAMEEIIELFADYRLLSLDHDSQTRQPTVEVAHEAILREWELLHGWINESRTELRLQRQLIGWVDDWNSANKETSYLLSGARLDQFEAWAKATTVALTVDEKHFLDASIKARNERNIREQARQQREQTLEQRSQQRMRYLVAALSVLLIIVAIFAIFAIDRQQRISDSLTIVQRESDVNRSLVLANDAIEAFELGETDLALQIALEAVNLPDTPAASVRALGRVAQGIGTRFLLSGHSNAVRDIAISPDNRFVASGSCTTLVDEICESGELILWNLQDGSELWRVDDNTYSGWITGLAFSPASDTIVASSAEGSIMLWNVDDGTVTQQFTGQDTPIYTLDYHPTEAQIVTAGENGQLLLWDVETGDIIQTFEGHTDAVNDVRFSADGSEILSGSDDFTVRLWDTATAEQTQVYEQNSDVQLGFEFVEFDAQNNAIFATHTQNYTWDKETAEVIRVEIHSLRISGLTVAQDGTMFQGLGHFLRWANPTIDSTNVVGQRVYDHHADVLTVAMSNDDRLLVSGAVDGEIRVWNWTAQLNQRINVVSPPASVSRLRLSPDENSLLIGAFDTNSAYMYDLDSQTISHQFEDEYPISWALEYSPNGRYAAVGSINFFQNDMDTTLALWNVDSGELVRTFDGHQIRVSDFSFSPDGRYLLSSSQNFAGAGELLLWDVETGELVRAFDNTDPLGNVEISSDGSFAMTTSYFLSYMALWDMETGERLQRLDFDIDAPIEFSRLGVTSDIALIGFDNGEMLEVDLETFEILRSFDGHTGTIWDIALSSDGAVMASGQADGIVIIWDYKTGREIGRIQHPGGFFVNLVFGPGDETLFTSAYLGDVLEWNLSNQSTESLITWVEENRYVRDFTCQERIEYQIEPLCQAGSLSQ